MRRRVASLLAIAALWASEGRCQYLLHTWEDFEAGTLSPKLVHLHNASPRNTRVVDLSTIPDPSIHQGPARLECGRFALEMKTDKTNRFLGIASPVTLTRARLGQHGKALFQADVYLKGHVNLGHTVAVAAIADSPQAPLVTGHKVWTLYRFGVLQQNKTYFSYTNSSPQPIIYLHQKLGEIVPVAEGWHRLQLVFEGDRTVSCHVDGRPTSFSPIVEGTFPALHPGMIVTAPEDAPLTVYIDNLSIQWTPEPGAPMPESPWVSSTALSAAPAGGPAWSVAPEAAMAEARKSGKPLLVMFYNPASIVCQDLMNGVFSSNRQAQQDLKKFELLKVDINQLRGGSLAEKFSVTRVPTFVVLGGDAKERGRVVASKDMGWSAIGAELKNAAGGT